MAELEKTYSTPFDLGETKILNRKFGRPEDNIELHIYDGNDNLLSSDEDFNGWLFPKNITGNLSSEIIVDPYKTLSSYGFNTGKYTIKLNVHRRKIVTGIDSLKGQFLKDFKITEISPSRTEIRATTGLANEGIEQAVGTFIRDLQSSVFFKEFGLNFGDNINITALDPRTFLSGSNAFPIIIDDKYKRMTLYDMCPHQCGSECPIK